METQWRAEPLKRVASSFGYSYGTFFMAAKTGRITVTRLDKRLFVPCSGDRAHRAGRSRSLLEWFAMSGCGCDEISQRFRIPIELLVEVRDRLGVRGRAGQDLSGMIFPYRDPRDGRLVGHRVRLDMPLAGGQKYLSEQGCHHPFFPPLSGKELNDISIPALIAEAEKSCLVLIALAGRHERKLL